MAETDEGLARPCLLKMDNKKCAHADRSDLNTWALKAYKN